MVQRAQVRGNLSGAHPDQPFLNETAGLLHNQLPLCELHDVNNERAEFQRQTLVKNRWTND